LSLLDKLNQDMKQAMRNKDKDTLSVIRMVKASLQNELFKSGSNSLSVDDELTVLNRELKQRKDSLQEFLNANREDLAEKVKAEIAVLQVYMPKQLSDEELLTIIKETIAETGASSKADFGKVMGALMPKVKGKSDGALVNQLVKQQLS
jgi:uncharacterized protein